MYNPFYLLWLNWSMVERSILIGSLNGPYWENLFGPYWKNISLVLFWQVQYVAPGPDSPWTGRSLFITPFSS